MTNRLSPWWSAIRFHYIPPSYLPVFLGSAAAWAITGTFSFPFFLVTVLAVTANHAALNMTDDYFDFIHAVDRARTPEKNPYSGGSGTLTSGLIGPAEMRNAFIALYLFTAASGILLTVTRGLPVLAFGLVGVASSYFYTAPPVRYAYRGFGEISQLFNFSLVIGLGSYFVQARELSLPAAFLVLPLGFMMFSMITINEIPDEQEDREGGKRNLVVIFGPETAVGLWAAGMAAAYLVITLLPLLGFAGFEVYAGLLTLPWFARAFRILKKNYGSPAAMAPANMLTIRIHNLTGILLTCAVLFSAVINGRIRFPETLPVLALLAVLYLPVALKVFRRKAKHAGASQA